MLACLSVSPVPYEVVLKPAILAGSPLFKGLTGRQRVKVLEGIGDLALVDFDVQEDVTDPAFAHVLSLHPLVHAMFRDRDEVREQIADYHGLVMKLLLAATEGQNPDYPPTGPTGTCWCRTWSRPCGNTSCRSTTSTTPRRYAEHWS
ncbi:hypothetical protein NKG94_39920 [Micromonospora sp. M12]